MAEGVKSEGLGIGTVGRWWKNWKTKASVTDSQRPEPDRILSAVGILGEIESSITGLCGEKGLPPVTMVTFTANSVLSPREEVESGFKRVFHGAGVNADTLTSIISGGMKVVLAAGDLNKNPYSFATNDFPSACAPRYACRSAETPIGIVFELHLPEKDLLRSFLGTEKGTFYGLRADSSAVQEDSLSNVDDPDRKRGLLKPGCLKDLYFVVYSENYPKELPIGIRVNDNKEFFVSLVRNLEAKKLI